MTRVVTLTVNPAVDVNTAVEVVAPEKKLRCDTPRYEPGGGGINVSRAMARLGAASRAIYLAGGPHGELLRRLLDDEGLDQTPLPIEGLTRESLIVFEHASGQQYRFGMPGPRVREAGWRRCMEALEAIDPPPAYVVASGSLAPGMPDDFFARLAVMVRGLGARLVLDTSGEPLRRGVDAGVFLIKPNLGEFRELVGDDLRKREDQERAARRLVTEGRAEVVLVSLGAAGALLADGDAVRHLQAPAVPIRSKVGAGDSMVAGIMTGLVRDLDLVDAARLGIASGAAAVMTDGTELCRREDTERLFDEIRGGV